MKRSNNLYKEACDFNNIVKMTNKICYTVKNKRKVNWFEIYKTEHLYNIKKRLDDRDLNVGKYNIFMITDPKCRIVMAQEIEDKIINHLIAEYVLVKVFEPRYTYSMCATRVGKGTLYGVKLLKKYLNEIKYKYSKFYVLKIDIHKYFYKIDHDILKDILSKKIKDKDALNFLYSVINSTDEAYVNEEILKLKKSRIKHLTNSNLLNRDKLIKEVEDIPLYEKGKGIALGNQTSQAFGLIYLYEFDHYVKEELHLKYFINYMDDFVILHNDKKYLEKCLDLIKIKLKEDYKLEFNMKKTKINSMKNGIDFLGYRFYIKNNKVILKLRNRTKKRFKRKVKNMKELYDYNLISKREFNSSIASYKGLLKWGTCNALYYRTVGEE